MTNAQTVNLTSPVGRLLWGDLYNPQTKNYDGKPLTNNDGSARVDYPVGVAFPKTAAAWWDEPWGKTILAVGGQAHPQSYPRPDFAWKIVDGDSMVPNRKNRKPAEQEGSKGHWVVRFSSGFAPNLFTLIGQPKPLALVEKNAIVPGYFVQVNFDVAGNGAAAKTPGVYLNHRMICLIAYGAVIQRQMDPEAAGFGAAPGALPAGASLTPPAAFNPPAPAPQAAPAAVSPPPPAAVPAPVAVAPHPAILQPPAPAVAPPPAATVPAPARVMTAKAGGATYEAYIAQGWTDATLVQHGYMNP